MLNWLNNKTEVADRALGDHQRLTSVLQGNPELVEPNPHLRFVRAWCGVLGLVPIIGYPKRMLPIFLFWLVSNLC